MVPTAHGQRIQPHVLQMLALVNAIPMPASMSLESIERTLSISATDHAQRIVVGDLIGELRRIAPGDPATGAWRSGPTMHAERSHHFAFTLPDGRVVVSHGTTSSRSPDGTTEVFNPATDTWSVAGNVIKFNGTINGAAMTPLGSGRVLVTGGAGAGCGIVLDQHPQGQLDQISDGPKRQGRSSRARSDGPAVAARRRWRRWAVLR
jgi:hypothetical protein